MSKTSKTVKIPEQFEPIFRRAQDYVSDYFKQRSEDAAKGTIEISGQRYIYVRAASMSVEFFETVRQLYSDKAPAEAAAVARNLLFDVAHAIGGADARDFHARMNVTDPIEKLSAGPVHFAHSGWAFVEILPESRPTPDEDYYLVYDHPYSFESDAWIRSGKPVDFPVCVMNAGYSSGWCEESFGLPLVATEILCKAKGDEACRFIMAPPGKIEGHVAAYLDRDPALAGRVTSYEIPGFFSRKQAEEALEQAYRQMEAQVQERTADLLAANEQLAVFRSFAEAAGQGLGMATPEGVVTYANPALCRMLGEPSLQAMVGKRLLRYYPEALQERLRREILPAVRSSGQWHGELCLRAVDGRITPTLENFFLIRDDRGEPLCVADVVTDYSEQKRAEEATRQSERKFRTLFERTPVGLCLAPLQAGPDGLWPAAETNPALDAILGRAAGDPAPVDFPRFADAEDYDFYQASLDELIAGRRGWFELHRRFCDVDGKPFEGHLTVALVKDAVDNPTHSICALQKVTVRG